METSKTVFTERELEIIELLKKYEIRVVAKKLGITRGTVDTTLFRIRNKIERAHNTVNVANNWKDSGKNPRLAKLLRRQT